MFKTSVFGGFNKEEVLEHIKIMEQRHQEEVTEMKKRISMLEEQLDSARCEAEEKDKLACDLRAELEARQVSEQHFGKEWKSLMERYFPNKESQGE